MPSMHQRRLMYRRSALRPRADARFPAWLPAARGPAAALAAAERARAQRPARGRAVRARDAAAGLVSYHLRQLRDGGLVSTRRSLADGRDAYYVLDLERCGELLASAGAALHPGLAPAAGGADASRTLPAVARVLFLCTGNSARSQIAEALAELLSDGAVRAASAGSHPKPLHPNAVRVMRARGVDLARPAVQAPEHVRRRALRLRHQPLRPRARGLPRVPRRPRADPLEHPRPGARARRRRGHAARLRAHGRRARHPDRLPARANRAPSPTRAPRR